jgi:hypothetical protein
LDNSVASIDSFSASLVCLHYDTIYAEFHELRRYRTLNFGLKMHILKSILAKIVLNIRLKLD